MNLINLKTLITAIKKSNYNIKYFIDTIKFKILGI